MPARPGFTFHSGRWDIEVAPHVNELIPDRPNIMLDLLRDGAFFARVNCTETKGPGIQIVSSALYFDKACRGLGGTIAGPHSWLALRSTPFRDDKDHQPHLGIEVVRLCPIDAHS